MRHTEAEGMDTDYRLKLAQRFHAVSNVSRSEIFGVADSRCMPINLHADARTMFAGYVGPRFTSGRGILFLAINPGGGGDAYTTRTHEDAVFYPLLEGLRTAAPAEILTAFEQVNDVFPSIVKAWNIWKILGPTLTASCRSLDQVAYMNIVPYRTRGDGMPPADVRRCAWTMLIQPTLEILQPRAIVTLGKKAGSVVDKFDQGQLHAYCVPRTRGDTRISDEARQKHEQMTKELCDATMRRSGRAKSRAPLNADVSTSHSHQPQEGVPVKASIYVVIFAAAVTNVGCATITQSENQSLALTATYEGKPVDPICQLKNDRGTWDSKAPANVMIRKSGEDLDVTCKKEGMPDGLLKAISRAAGSMFGNIIFGGGIGAIIDHNKGTGYDYPDQLPVKMGESVVVDKKPSEQQATQKSCPSGQQC